MCKENLILNNLQRLICRKTQPTKIIHKWYIFRLNNFCSLSYINLHSLYNSKAITVEKSRGNI